MKMPENTKATLQGIAQQSALYSKDIPAPRHAYEHKFRSATRMHSKRIYAKLNVHKKQELIDLVDSLDPKSGS
ncbi:hypothetical protein [Gordonibacter sp.]|uniref:hypothetical protein n=1 Tax=Gordonibacter sp. TaxID=1968902 RepID=UPI002FC7F99E